MSELLETCEKCKLHYSADPKLAEHCFSVGREYGYSADVMLKSYLTDYHMSGHYERLEPARP